MSLQAPPQGRDAVGTFKALQGTSRALELLARIVKGLNMEKISHSNSALLLFPNLNINGWYVLKAI